MKVLVTGGAGFIGANFAQFTLKEHPGHQVTVVDKLTYAGNRESLKPVEDEIAFVEGDICDPELMDGLISENDLVVHFAAESHNDNSLHSPWPFLQTNIIGTYTILEAVRKHGKRIHHISTDEVFGDLALDSTEKFDEQRAYNPSSPYSASKASSDHLVRAWQRSFGVNATITNCANNYGPYQHVEKFIPRQITEILEGRKPKLYGDGKNVREWTHVDDHNRAVWMVIEEGKIGETYLIGSGDERGNKEIVEMILELMGKPKDWYEHVSDRPGHDLRYSNNSDKLRENLGWKPEYADLKSGLEATVKWFEENEWWWKPHKKRTEAKYKELGR
jgi:dTDP-glucose 4,6-dehydratase